MKTAKSITVVLFMLTAQIVCAYYCPSTGRWLSRDPLGEPGFELFRASGAVPRVDRVVSIASLPGLWINRDSNREKKEPSPYPFVANNPIMSVDSLGLCTAYLCKRPVDFLYSPIARNVPYHWFLKASFGLSEESHCLCSCSANGSFNLLTEMTLEVGLGEQGGGVPGQNSPLNPLNWYPLTQPVDHSGQSEVSGTSCEPVTIQNCCGLLFGMLDRSPTGHRFPFYNCHSWVNDQINQNGPPPSLPYYSGGPENAPTVF
jgi:hypothetical protein